ncbi:MAG: aminotransferase class I/II-fold pyridoxal phosphate-dependent enzyme [Spirochaetia bacterium]|nr:aminotransferase class I/II-fold pyridoxal phosphate-dependent enzyme [Spirochaetia bacterium]
MKKYEHGGRLDELKRIAGKNIDAILDFSSNINPLGIPKKMQSAVKKSLDEITRYPDPESVSFREAVSKKYAVPVDCITAGGGASELLHAAIRAAKLKKAVIPAPSYSDYERAAEVCGCKISYFKLPEKENFNLDFKKLNRALKGGEVVFLGNPNNPAGKTLNKKDLLDLIEKNKKSFFIIDESFLDFTGKTNESLLYSNIQNNPLNTFLPANAVIVVSLTKIFAIPGIRAAFAVSGEKFAKALRNELSSWPISALAEAAASCLCDMTEYIDQSVNIIQKEKKYLYEELEKLRNLKVYFSDANFLLIKLTDENTSAAKLYDFLLKKNILIRKCSNFKGLDDTYIRVAVRLRKDNEKLVEAVREYF